MKNKDPQLLLQRCDCGSPNCRTVTIAMIRPVIKPIDGSEELACCVQFPIECAQPFVDLLREICLEKGLDLK